MKLEKKKPTVLGGDTEGPLNRAGNGSILGDNETDGELCPEETKTQKTA